MKGKYGDQVDKGIETCIQGVLKLGNYTVSAIYFDGEKAIKENKEFENYKTQVIKLPGTHIAQAEVGIKIVKERIWHRHALLAFNLPRALLEHLVRCMTRYVNASPREFIEGEYKIIKSPREHATNTPVHFNQVKFSFGDLVAWKVVNERGVDAMKAGVVLFPSFDSDNSYYILSLESGTLNDNAVVKTGRVKELKWTLDYKNKVESLGDLIRRDKFKESEFEEVDPDMVEQILKYLLLKKLQEITWT